MLQQVSVEVIHSQILQQRVKNNNTVIIIVVIIINNVVCIIAYNLIHAYCKPRTAYYTVCANKKQSLRKNSLSQLL